MLAELFSLLAVNAKNNSFRLNEKGNLLFILIGALVLIAVLPAIFIYVFPQAQFLLALILIFTIWGSVRMYLGDGVLTLLITGVLTYLIVFKHIYLASSIFTLQILLMFGFFSVVIFGIANTMSKH